MDDGDTTGDQGRYDTEQVMYVIVTGLCCMMLLCIFLFTPLAKKWDSFITKVLAGKTAALMNQQHMDQDHSSHVSDVIMLGYNDHQVVAESDFSLESEEEEKGKQQQQQKDDEDLDKQDNQDWVQRMVQDLTQFECASANTSTVPSTIQQAWMRRITYDDRNHDSGDDDSQMSRTLFVVRSEDDEMVMNSSFSSVCSQITNDSDSFCSENEEGSFS